MATKKSNKNVGGQKEMSPVAYIKSKVRQLPIDSCYINRDFEVVGTASIIVVRRHPKGTLTVGSYLVDTWCRGVYDSFYKFSIEEYELKDILSFDKYLKKVEYEFVHNLIYGAIEYAEEAGIEPCKEFDVTEYILDEDTDDIPLMEFSFGRNGKHFLFVKSNLEASRYLPLLEKNLGDKYEYAIDDDDDYYDEDKDYYGVYDDDDDVSGSDNAELLSILAMGYDNFRNTNTGLDSVYDYKHPAYPSDLELKHPELKRLLEEKTILKKKDINNILAIPHDELRQDLENMAWMELSRNSEGVYDDGYNPIMANIVILLGSVGNESSLDLIFELMRQDDDFRYYHFGDMSEVILHPTLYELSKNHVRKLVDYIKEPGLNDFFRVDAVTVLINGFVYFMPERRDEIIGYGKELLEFLLERQDDPRYMNGEVSGFLCSSLADIHAVETLPLIKNMFDTGNVDEGIDGGYSGLEESMNSSDSSVHLPMGYDIYKIYKKLS